MTKLFSKDELISEIKRIAQNGWHKSVKATVDMRNDGAVGNTLERLLGIEENNLPVPNAQEWELKGQRAASTSLVTLKHVEPSPRAVAIVPHVLLDNYGWPHKQAGAKYPASEMSFRSTTSAHRFTNRGFRILVDRSERKLRFQFDPARADTSDPVIRAWIQSVKDRVGLGQIVPEPYWGFDDLEHSIGTKVLNCFYVTANVMIEDGHEYFHYVSLRVLSGYSFERFLRCLESGVVVVDFDARTGHNHGTKFRIKQDAWDRLYESVKRVF